MNSFEFTSESESESTSDSDTNYSSTGESSESFSVNSNDSIRKELNEKKIVDRINYTEQDDVSIIDEKNNTDNLGNNIQMDEQIFNDTEANMIVPKEINHEFHSKVCSQLKIPSVFSEKEDLEYYLRLSQCLIQKAFTVPLSDTTRYQIKCKVPTCNFSLLCRISRHKGCYIKNGICEHSCTAIDHTSFSSPASCNSFLKKYLKNHIQNGISSNQQLCDIVKRELKCDIHTSTMNRVLQHHSKIGDYENEQSYKYLNAYIHHIQKKWLCTH